MIDETPGAAELSDLPLLAGVGLDAAWTYVGLIASTFGGLFVAAFVLRTLSAADYGTFSIAMTIVGLLAVFDFGISAASIGASARERHAAERLRRDGDVSDARRAMETGRAEVQGAHGLNVVVAIVTLVATAAVLILETLSGTTGQVATMTALVGMSAGLGFGTATYLGIATGQRRFGLVALAVVCGTAAEIVVVMMFARPLGLPALGLAELASIVVARGVLATGVRHSAPWFRPTCFRGDRAALRAGLVFSGPLLVLGAAGQVIASTDVLVLGVMSSAAVVGLYRVGSTVPTQLAALLHRGQDSVFPALSASSEHRSQEHAIDVLTRLFALAGGVTFGVLILDRGAVADLLVGHPSRLAASVIGIFCLIWLVNLPAHGIALLMIARAQQRSLMHLVAVEAVANLGLTVVFINIAGPLGAAWATLTTIAVSNLIVLPLLARKSFSISTIRLTLWSGIGCELLGGSAALVATIAASSLSAGVFRLCVAGSIALVLGMAAIWVISGASGRTELACALRPATAPGTKAAVGFVQS